MADHKFIIFNLVKRRLGSNQPLRYEASFVPFMGAVPFKVFPFKREICTSSYALGTILFSRGPFLKSKRGKTPGQ
eukprot:2861398-Ditylum_brightwellii.AAC.1